MAYGRGHEEMDWRAECVGEWQNTNDLACPRT